MDTSIYGAAGAELVTSVIEQMAEDDLLPDARDRSLLDTAARLVDHMERLREAAEAGAVCSTSATGIVRVHPAIIEYRQTAVALAKVLASVALVETNGMHKDPVKQRAAQARWDRHRAALAAREAR